MFIECFAFQMAKIEFLVFNLVMNKLLYLIKLNNVCNNLLSISVQIVTITVTISKIKRRYSSIFCKILSSKEGIKNVCCLIYP